MLRPQRRLPGCDVPSRGRPPILRPTPCPILLAVVLATVVLIGAPAAERASAATAAPIEDYASYQPQRWCSPRPKPGTVTLLRWTVRRFGGAAGGISRACGDGVSEHKEGRAFDWSLDARRVADRRRARAFLTALRATDRAGNADARARRMGVMYVIWDDRMFAAWNRFRPEPYLSSSCRRVRRCSVTLRHRDHLHVSLTRAGARGRTSWYEGRL